MSNVRRYNPDRIHALRQMTVERGCTHEEADTAARILREMLDVPKEATPRSFDGPREPLSWLVRENKQPLGYWSSQKCPVCKANKSLVIEPVEEQSVYSSTVEDNRFRCKECNSLFDEISGGKLRIIQTRPPKAHKWPTRNRYKGR